MRTVKSLREELAKFPDDALCYAYEGETTGVVIRSAREELGVIVCVSGKQCDTEVHLRGDDGKVYVYADNELSQPTQPPVAR